VPYSDADDYAEGLHAWQAEVINAACPVWLMGGVLGQALLSWPAWFAAVVLLVVLIAGNVLGARHWVRSNPWPD
jgi:hypothetical protein